MPKGKKCPRCEIGVLTLTSNPDIVACASCGARGRVSRNQSSGQQKPVVASRSQPINPAKPTSAKRPEPNQISKICYGLAICIGILGLVLLVVGPFDGNRAARLQYALADLNSHLDNLNQDNLTFKKEITAATESIQTMSDSILQRNKDIEDIEYRRVQNEKVHQAQLANLKQEQSQMSGHDIANKAHIDATATPRQVDMVELVSEATVVIRTDVASGSGFIFQSNGLVLTNYHVIQLSSKIEVSIRLPGSKQTITLSPVTVKIVDPTIDLAVLQLPPAPKEISDDGTYPTLEIREHVPQAGEPVVVIGSPGFANDLLEFTVTKGIVSNSSRMLNGVPLIQTTAAINSGNSGGPMVDERGKVVGVVTLKGVGVEGVGFAVSTAAARSVISRHSRTSFEVRQSLAEWEKLNSPLDAFSRLQISFRPSFELSFDVPVTKMLLVDGGLLLIQGEIGQVSRFNLNTQKIDASCNLGSLITDACLDDSNQNLYVISPELSTIYRIDTKTLKSTDRSAITGPYNSIVYLGGHERFLIAYDKMTPNRTPLLVDGSSLSKPKLITYEFTMVSNLIFADGDGKYMFLIRRDTALTQLEILPRSKMSRILDKITDGLDIPASASSQTRERLRQAQSESYAEYEKIAIKIRMSNRALVLQNNIIPMVYSAGRSNMMFGRTLYRVGNDDVSEIGTLADNPDKEMLVGILGPNSMVTPLIDTIFAVSSDGNYAASGLHIYDLKTRKAIKRLPAVSSRLVFSADNSDLYVYDEGQNSLLVVEDWKNSLASFE